MSKWKREDDNCKKCGERMYSCDRCETDLCCPCCPCECKRPDPSPAALESMARYDAANKGSN